MHALSQQRDNLMFCLILNETYASAAAFSHAQQFNLP
jgi:hypothetical protein